MDFSFDDDQQAIQELAAKLLREQAGHERLRELERSGGPRFDRALWQALAEAGLLGTALPERFGGAGLGFLELALILQEVGRNTAPAPLYETLVLGALPLAELGPEALRSVWLPRVVAGEAVLSAALQERAAAPEAPATLARRTADGFALDGEKVCVPAGQVADAFWVSARDEAGVAGLYWVERDAPGVTLTALDTTSGAPEALLALADVPVPMEARLVPAAGGADPLPWLLLRARAGQCALALGVCEAALALTAAYVKERKQFDQPIAMFQAVGHRAANAYIDVEAIRLTTWQAASRIGLGLPAEAEVAAAKFWAAEGGQRVVHAAQHLHGGLGVDRDYPLWRTFTWLKELELSLGGATPQLLAIGRWLADAPPA